ncbi:hypothetical protein FB45DRAFT_908468 [Roridomyces roridus]|uniref:Uncharacterized protein n=1 Tax=Roridomyces roridus TaxID=1738132 RepID=A0AAD7FSW7_9AGAR|nr:hypothetical protein FB45DRAFT_908468 [Roridomyces roridus]
MVSLLTQLRFGHEGTRRRAFYHPLVKEWQDMTTLAILDTDWALRSVIRSAPKSLWDEMFLRHERERDELLRWENRSLKRSASTETIRVGGGGADPVDTDSSAASDSEHSSVESSRSKGKRRKVEEDPYDGSSSDYDTAGSDYAFSELDVVQFDGRTPSPAPSDLSAESVPPSPAPSDWSVESHPLSPVSSAGEWEVLDSYGVDE